MVVPRFPADIACAQQPHLFFGGINERKQAIELCQSCPVKEQCLTIAIEKRPVAGVFGGVDFTRNQNEADEEMFPKRKPGRPRKNP